MEREEGVDRTLEGSEEREGVRLEEEGVKGEKEREEGTGKRGMGEVKIKG